MADYLIDEPTQDEIAGRIDAAVLEVLSEIPNHGSEEGITPVLGHALMRQSFRSDGLRVEFNYRQLNKLTEERAAGADGGIVVRVITSRGTTEKAALFQAKRLAGARPVRRLSMRADDARRLQTQAADMLRHTDEAVALFYTDSEIYVVDAARYETESVDSIQHPLSKRHRLVTLGTYLGRWVPRCTRGDQDEALITRVQHLDGFKRGLTMNVITTRPSIPWKDDPDAERWRAGRRWK